METADRTIRLCVVWGEATDLLPHFINHYQELGVTHFHFVVHITSANDPFLAGATKILSQFDLRPETLYIGVWNGAESTRQLNRVLAAYPDDWFVIADSDEFQIYPEGIGTMIAGLEARNRLFLTGCLLDRLSRDGSLQLVNDRLSLWEQFPIAGFVSYPVMRAFPVKITLCKGVVLSEGQHGVIVPDRSYPIRSEAEVQVHHFKWVSGLRKKLEERLVSKANGLWADAYQEYEREINDLLTYLTTRQDRIDIADPRLRCASSGSAFADYPYWHQIKQIVADWPSLRSSPVIDHQI